MLITPEEMDQAVQKTHAVRHLLRTRAGRQTDRVTGQHGARRMERHDAGGINEKKFFGITLTALPFALISVSALLLALSRPVEAQQPANVYRIGLLHSASNEVPEFTQAFRQGMRERGYVEGKNYLLEIRARRRKTDQLSDFAAELVGLKADIILTVGRPALLAAKEATSTIPIVMHTGSDPVRSGFVSSLAHPVGILRVLFPPV